MHSTQTTRRSTQRLYNKTHNLKNKIKMQRLYYIPAHLCDLCAASSVNMRCMTVNYPVHL